MFDNLGVSRLRKILDLIKCYGPIGPVGPRGEIGPEDPIYPGDPDDYDPRIDSDPIQECCLALVVVVIIGLVL